MLVDYLPQTKKEQKNLKKHEIQYIFNETKLDFSTIWLTEISQIYVEILREKASNIVKLKKKNYGHQKCLASMVIFLIKSLLRV